MMTRGWVKRSFQFGLLVPGIFAAGSLGTTASAQEALAYPYDSGKDIYEHVCQACHMPDAKGAIGAGAYPALAGNPRLEVGLYPVMIMLRGMKSMPSFPELNDEQIAAVANYLRTSYGNNFAEPVTVEQVKELRPTAVTRRRGRAG
jgi:mono/diheme cytochrome c family protein